MKRDTYKRSKLMIETIMIEKKNSYERLLESIYDHTTQSLRIKTLIIVAEERN